MKKLFFIALLLPLIALNLKAQDKENKPTFCEDSIKVIDNEPFSYISYEKKGSYDQMNAAYTALWEESVKQFLAYDENGFFAIYHNSSNDTETENLKWEVAAKFTEGADDEVLEPLKKKKWDYKKLVSIKYDGPLGDEIGQAYGAMMKFIAKNNYQVVGPSLQKNLNRAHKNKDGVYVGLVEIWLPVETKK